MPKVSTAQVSVHRTPLETQLIAMSGCHEGFLWKTPLEENYRWLTNKSLEKAVC